MAMFESDLFEDVLPFIEVNSGGWDLHQNTFTSLEKKLPELDEAFFASLKVESEAALRERSSPLLTLDVRERPELARKYGVAIVPTVVGTVATAIACAGIDPSMIALEVTETVLMDDPELAHRFTTFWQTPQADAVTRMKLFKLAWDMVGSEFAGRHLQYEKFYAGASFIIRNHSYRETDWNEFNALIDKVMSGYGVPKDGKQQAAE